MSCRNNRPGKRSKTLPRRFTRIPSRCHALSRRRVITTMYPSMNSVAAAKGSDDPRALPPTQTLIHRGRPRSVQAVYAASLANLARASGGVIEVVVAVGDTVVELMPLLH